MSEVTIRDELLSKAVELDDNAVLNEGAIMDFMFSVIKKHKVATGLICLAAIAIGVSKTKKLIKNAKEEVRKYKDRKKLSPMSCFTDCMDGVKFCRYDPEYLDLFIPIVHELNTKVVESNKRFNEVVSSMYNCTTSWENVDEQMLLHWYKEFEDLAKWMESTFKEAYMNKYLEFDPKPRNIKDMKDDISGLRKYMLEFSRLFDPWEGVDYYLTKDEDDFWEGIDFLWNTPDEDWDTREHKELVRQVHDIVQISSRFDKVGTRIFEAYNTLFTRVFKGAYVQFKGDAPKFED